jgi:hypothetical protein
MKEAPQWTHKPSRSGRQASKVLAEDVLGVKFFYNKSSGLLLHPWKVSTMFKLRGRGRGDPSSEICSHAKAKKKKGYDADCGLPWEI